MSALLEVDAVSKSFPMGGLLSREQIEAVVDIDVTLLQDRPEIFTIVGESGSGKTTLARLILGLETPTRGEIRHLGQPVGAGRFGAQRHAFMSAVQPVFQNPFEAFNPLKRVDRYLASTARAFRSLTRRAEIEAAMDAALVDVGLSLEEIRGRYPHELSGGQLQRAAIARALVCEARILIADEPVSMVDASLRMAIVNLLRRLRDDKGVTVIYITHDLATAYYISDRIMIMQKGRVVETGPARRVLNAPQHPYSRLLKASVLSAADAGQGNLAPAQDLFEASQEALEVARDSRMIDLGEGHSVRRAG
ncbi:ABC transporter ATP-binding protein [Pseudoroseicyclus aestuarii]|uniref:Peptide/nickel transport system ATP-binding protein n=1 Tax=Pseudoroseicyclus aestuarii TaxID=1795041 RepID=A0A318ST28_9RHOB|nr:ABC transporter ATP-binding protein [Pseudoroseicyclus aestuarii]PYE82462.1 peptide/nickel transport system ATP-binding protein [Pseudoroseicyclus aestuarii]